MSLKTILDIKNNLKMSNQVATKKFYIRSQTGNPTIKARRNDLI